MFPPPPMDNNKEKTQKSYLLTFKTFSSVGNRHPPCSAVPFSPQIKAEDDQPLPGVLLSLSGGVFRSNLLTQDNGILTFSNLVRCPVVYRR